jgi:hypothetical protein
MARKTLKVKKKKRLSQEEINFLTETLRDLLIGILLLAIDRYLNS